MCRAGDPVRAAGRLKSRHDIAERWGLSVEAADWLLDDCWPRIAGVADRGWAVLAMLRESQWYRRCGLVQVHHESPWSSADVDACIDSMLDRLAEDDREFTVHDCLLQPEGVHIAVTCADRDLGSE